MVLTKAWANALGKYNITVNAIYPGLTVTERTYTNLAEQAKRENTTVEALKQALDDRIAAEARHHCRGHRLLRGVPGFAAGDRHDGRGDRGLRRSKHGRALLVHSCQLSVVSFVGQLRTDD